MRNATGYMFTTLPGRSDRASLQVDGNMAEGECLALSAFTGQKLKCPASVLYRTDVIYYVRTFWKNVFIAIAYLFASPRRADIINYVPTEGKFTYQCNINVSSV